MLTNSADKKRNTKIKFRESSDSLYFQKKEDFSSGCITFTKLETERISRKSSCEGWNVPGVDVKNKTSGKKQLAINEDEEMSKIE